MTVLRDFHTTETRYSVIHLGDDRYAITDKWWRGQSAIFDIHGRRRSGRLCLGHKKASQLIEDYENSTWSSPSVEQLQCALGARD